MTQEIDQNILKLGEHLNRRFEGLDHLLNLNFKPMLITLLITLNVMGSWSQWKLHSSSSGLSCQIKGELIGNNFTKKVWKYMLHSYMYGMMLVLVWEYDNLKKKIWIRQ